MKTWAERCTGGSSSRNGWRNLPWLTAALAVLLITGPALAITAYAQDAEITAPGVRVKVAEAGGGEVEALGVSVKVAPPQVQETPQGETIDLSGAWKFKGDWLESGLAEGWYRPDFDDSDWRALHVPGSWESQGVNSPNPRWPVKTEECGYNGYAWYRTRFAVPESWADGRIEIELGQVWDEDWTYLNGQALGQTTGDEAWDTERRYLIPPGLLRVGEENLLAVRVLDREHEGGLAVGPVELVNTSAATEGTPSPPETREYTSTQGDVVRLGSSVTIPAEEKVQGDVVVIGGNVDVSGYVAGDVAAIGGVVRVRDGGFIEGDVTAVGGSIHQDSGGAIGGEMVEIGPGINLPGSWFGREDAGRARHTFFMVGALGPLFVFAFLVLLAVLLFHHRLETMAAALPVHPGRAALYGVAGLLLTPAALVAEVLVGAFVTVLLVVTLVGILAIPAVWAAVAALLIGWVLLLSSGVIAVWLGLGKGLAAALKKPDLHPIWAGLLGLVLVAVAAKLPVVGGLVIMTLIVFGFGLAVMTGFGTDPEWAHRRLGFRTSPSSPQKSTTSVASPLVQAAAAEDDALALQDEGIPQAEPEETSPATEAEGEPDLQPLPEVDELESASPPVTEASEEGEERLPEA